MDQLLIEYLGFSGELSIKAPGTSLVLGSMPEGLAYYLPLVCAGGLYRLRLRRGGLYIEGMLYRKSARGRWDIVPRYAFQIDSREGWCCLAFHVISKRGSNDNPSNSAAALVTQHGE